MFGACLDRGGCVGQAGLRILCLDVELARVAGGGVAGGEALLLAARRLAAAHPNLHSQQ